MVSSKILLYCILSRLTFYMKVWAAGAIFLLLRIIIKVAKTGAASLVS